MDQAQRDGAEVPGGDAQAGLIQGLALMRERAHIVPDERTLLDRAINALQENGEHIHDGNDNDVPPDGHA